MSKLIFIDQIAQGGEQGWAQPYLPEPEIKKDPLLGVKFAVVFSLPFWIAVFAMWMGWLKI